MKEIKRDFNKRKNEINTYFIFLENLLIYDTVSWNGNSQEKILSELRSIMKSNIFLMLYNLTESSISAAIEQIHISIKRDKNISFDNVNEGIKIKLIRYLKNKKKVKKFIDEIDEISIDIISSCFDKKGVFSGNAGRREINDLAKQYGFSINSDYKKTKHGKKLDKVKDHRNALAHGVFSFREIGKEYTLTDIREFKDETIAYLEQIIENIEIYINKKAYNSVK
ncbi:MAG: hypothetical protein K8S14_07905 [Actinomycetia bacterium]|nr:hypothetical protein [Actinomycetes bacterium]